MIRCVREAHPTRRRRATRWQAAPGPAPRRLRGAAPVDPSLVYDGELLDGTRIRRQSQPAVEEITGWIDEGGAR